MSVLITGRDCSISDTDKPFYRVESSNLANSGYAQLSVLNYPVKFTYVSFSNSCNVLGVGALIWNPNTLVQDSGLYARLDSSMSTCTMTVANPCVVTKTAHGLTQNTTICFSTTGALPTGITADSIIYYVQNPSTNSFGISTVPDGSLITTSGTQSGSHTLWQVLTDSSLDATYIVPTDVLDKRGVYSTNFDFNNHPAVDTANNKYRLYMNIITGPSGKSYNAISSAYAATLGALNYWVWGDVSLNFTDNDVPIFRYHGLIDVSCTFGNSASASVYICSNVRNISDNNISLLEWENPPKSSYTLNLSAHIVIGAYGGFTIGSSENRIPYNKQAIIVCPGISIKSFGYSNSYVTGLCSLQFYGQEPSIRVANITSQAAGGQKVINLNVDVSGYWLVGDTVMIGPLETGSVTTSNYTINSIDGSTITLSSNLTFNALAGGVVCDLNRYGVYFNGTSKSAFTLGSPLYLNFQGTRVRNFDFNFVTAYSNQVTNIPTSLRKRHEFSGCYFSGGYNIGVNNYTSVPQAGFSCVNNLTSAIMPIGAMSSYNTAAYRSGDILVKNNIMTYSVSNIIHSTIAAPGATRNLLFEDNKFYNMNSGTYYIIGIGGANNIIRNNKIYGCNDTNAGVILLTSLTNTEFYNNTYNKCAKIFGMNANIFLNNVKSYNESFGNLSANTNDVVSSSGVYLDWTQVNPSTNVNFVSTDYDLAISSSQFRVTNENGIPNVDTTYMPFGIIKRTGDGLADTTVHTAGTGKFAMRFEPTSLTDPIYWEQYIPTGNIQNKTMNISAWVKINSSTYYSGTTYQMPMLMINYDNGTLIYTNALAITDWQLLTLSFTPATTYGRISLNITGLTDASVSDAYFYLDDLNVFYPPDVQLALGGLDLWADGMPVTPSISTNVNATDVWNIQTSVLNSTGTIGKKVVDLDKNIPNKIIPLLFSK
jgi:hypothetical protein